MAVIREDPVGLYVAVGGYEARPVDATRYTRGDRVKAYHFGGTFFAGIGKGPGMPAGQYVETLITTGGDGAYSGRGQYLWYMLKAIQTGRFKREMTNAEIAEAEAWWKQKISER